MSRKACAILVPLCLQVGLLIEFSGRKPINCFQCKVDRSQWEGCSLREKSTWFCTWTWIQRLAKVTSLSRYSHMAGHLQTSFLLHPFWKAGNGSQKVFCSTLNVVKNTAGPLLSRFHWPCQRQGLTPQKIAALLKISILPCIPTCFSLPEVSLAKLGILFYKSGHVRWKKTIPVKPALPHINLERRNTPDAIVQIRKLVLWPINYSRHKIPMFCGRL